MTPPSAAQFPTVAIIGAGHSGLCMAMQLKRRGLDNFVLLEKSAGLGGTWRDNTYPGAGCDSPAFEYCFSFAQKTDWSRKWAPQAEILDYLEECARRYRLGPHLRFGAEVASARFDADTSRWQLETTAGDAIEADVVVSGVGQLHHPRVPAIPGLNTFAGATFHSARWDHAVDLVGKRVAVVGNAASALQFIPRIAARCAQLTVLQRSANWVIPKRDRRYAEWEKALLARSPELARLYRWWLWLGYEARHSVLLQNPVAVRLARRMALAHLRAQVADPDLRRQLTPEYPIGAKRILLSDEYYPALQRDNVRLVTDGIERIVDQGVVTHTGELIAADVLILATGFETQRFLAPMSVTGRSGQTLDQAWRDGAEAYLGMSVAGFPNLFMMYGPNTNLGHNSILFMIECQCHYIIDCIEQMRQRGLRSVEIRRQDQRDFVTQLEKRLARTAWAHVEHSWYKDQGGRITNNWPGTTIEYWWRTRRADLSRYVTRRAAEPKAWQALPLGMGSRLRGLARQVARAAN
jgi:cation diffusion facilitator CzcD-associated flavoprotein CzcO